MRRPALVAFAAAVLGLGLLIVVPFLTNERTFPAELMVPWPGLGGPVQKLQPGATLCIEGVTAEHHGGVARVFLTPYRQPGPRLALTLAGPGYRTQGSLAGGYRRPGVFAIPVRPPARDTLATACIRNIGRRKVGLFSYPSRLGSRPAATLNGQPIDRPPVFGLWEPGRHSVAQRLSLTLRRVALFRGPLGHAWIVAVALILAVAALVGCFGAALGLSMRREIGG